MMFDFPLEKFQNGYLFVQSEEATCVVGAAAFWHKSAAAAQLSCESLDGELSVMDAVEDELVDADDDLLALANSSVASALG